MSVIKPKKGKCIDCGPGSEDVYILAGRCYCSPPFHYQKHKESSYKKRSEMKKKVSNSLGEMTLAKWFNKQISIMPKYCENCGEYLNPYAPWSARAYIAHIVPKRHFHSVKTHSANRLFLCIDCHADYDNRLSDDVVKMPIYKIAVERFLLFKDLIDPSELRHIQPLFERYIS